MLKLIAARGESNRSPRSRLRQIDFSVECNRRLTSSINAVISGLNSRWVKISSSISFIRFILFPSDLIYRYAAARPAPVVIGSSGVDSAAFG
jgi:hypothetical protein